MRLVLTSAAVLALAACGQTAANNAIASENGVNPAVASLVANAAGAASDNGAEPVLNSETVSGTFSGWEMGDYLWAKIDVPGRETISAQPGPSPIDLFLDSNRGRPVTVTISTVRAHLAENGGPTEIQRITAASNAAGTAEAWWQGLPAADRLAAQDQFEQGALSGR